VRVAREEIEGRREGQRNERRERERARDDVCASDFLFSLIMTRLHSDTKRKNKEE
jgi:hypothetical protein